MEVSRRGNSDYASISDSFDLAPGYIRTYPTEFRFELMTSYINSPNLPTGVIKSLYEASRPSFKLTADISLAFKFDLQCTRLP